jgi:hypothetical protein
MWLMADPQKKKKKSYLWHGARHIQQNNYHTGSYKIRTVGQASSPSFGDKFDRDFD